MSFEIVDLIQISTLCILITYESRTYILHLANIRAHHLQLMARNYTLKQLPSTASSVFGNTEQASSRKGSSTSYFEEK